MPQTVGRIYHVTFIDTNSEVGLSNLYDRGHAITAADRLCKTSSTCVRTTPSAPSAQAKQLDTAALAASYGRRLKLSCLSD